MTQAEHRDISRKPIDDATRPTVCLVSARNTMAWKAGAATLITPPSLATTPGAATVFMAKAKAATPVTSQAERRSQAHLRLVAVQDAPAFRVTIA